MIINRSTKYGKFGSGALQFCFRPIPLYIYMAPWLFAPRRCSGELGIRQPLSEGASNVAVDGVWQADNRFIVIHPVGGLQSHFSFEKSFCKVCKVIFRLKNRFAKSAKSFFVWKNVLQSLQSHFSLEKSFCKVCKVIFRLKNRFAKSAKPFFVKMSLLLSGGTAINIPSVLGQVKRSSEWRLFPNAK